MSKRAYKSHVYKSAIYYTVNTSLKLPPRFKKKQNIIISRPETPLIGLSNYHPFLSFQRGPLSRLL